VKRILDSTQKKQDVLFAPSAGFADYLLAFKPDGRLGHAWLIDAVPDPVLGETLRTYAENMTAASVPGGSETGLRMRGCPSCMTMAVIGRHLRVKQQVSSP
jgi:hypothetical protein